MDFRTFPSKLINNLSKFTSTTTCYTRPTHIITEDYSIDYDVNGFVASLFQKVISYGTTLPLFRSYIIRKAYQN